MILAHVYPRSLRQKAFAALLLLFSCAAASAQTRIHVGNMLDVESGKWQSNQVLVVDEERITDVRSFNASLDADSIDVDLSAYYVIPGLIDLHVHLTSSADVHGYRRLSRSITRSAIYGVTAAEQTLKAGFTTVRNVGAAGFADVALRDAINEGEVLGPRMRVSGPSICITGGHCDGGILAPDFEHENPASANGPWEVRRRVRENIKYGADVIKFAASGGVLSKGTDVNASQFSLEEMQSLIDEAHDRGRVVAAHAHGKNGIKRAIQAGVDSIEHASLIDEEGIKMAKKAGTVLVMDIYVSDYILGEGEKAGILPESLDKERQVGKLQRENFRKAHKAGAKIAFGTDAGVYPHGQNGRQFAYMVRWGMSELEAIQAATIHAAELLNWRNDKGDLNVGTLRAGGFADLVAVKQSPLENISALEKIDVVVKGGKPIQ